MSKDSIVAIDLFSGCGGLSLGLQRAGFDIQIAVEKDSASAATFRANHPHTLLIEADICDVTPAQLRSKGGSQIGLLAGCAPCQGFCSLTSKHRKEDPRNRLVLEMARLIEGVRPKAVMMENVPGLVKRGEKILKEFLAVLDRLGYKHEWRIVQMADYGVPQYRRRFVLLAGDGFKIPFPKPTRSKPSQGNTRWNWKTLRDVIGGMSAPTKLSEAWKHGGPRKFDWHVVRDLQQQTKQRLKAATPGQTWLTVPESVRPRCHRGEYKGFTNVYGRMSWNQTPVTMTGGCTTPCKGRFGHPDKRRTTISVREAALIQTFPKSYQFKTDYMDVACEMIGNAVPPLFAEKVARQILKALEEV